MRKEKFKDIFEDLHRKITGGDFVAGTQLPSLPLLAEQYATSRPTIRKALQLLEKEGLVTCRNGIGVTVSDPSTRTSASGKKRLEIAADLFPGENNYFNYMTPILNGLSKASEKLGFSLRLLQRSEIEHWKEAGNLPDGLILHAFPDKGLSRHIIEAITEHEVPLILFNRTIEHPGVGTLSVDYRQETRRAVSCMIRNGAKRIVLYKNPGSLENALHLRVLGWRDAYLENDLPVPEELCITASCYEEANHQLSTILKRERPDMIFITNGTCFYQVCITLASHSLSVPEDIALLCFDDIGALQEELGIPASYIRMPLERMSMEAAESIIAIKNNPIASLPRKVFHAELIVKGCRYLLQE